MVPTPRFHVRAICHPIYCGLTVAVVASACGSTSIESVTGPDVPKCTVTLTAPNAIAASGGSATVTVSTQPECEWTAVAEGGWITDLTPTRGQGSGDVQFRAAPNPNGSARDGAITVNGQRAPIQQSAAPTPTPTPSPTPTPGPSPTPTPTPSPTPAPQLCTVTLQPVSISLPASGGSNTFAVAANGGCQWTAATQTPWITLTTTTNGVGSGSVGFTVAANPGAARVGTVSVSGATFTVNQSAAACASSIDPTSITVGEDEVRDLTVAVTLSNGCSWTATSSVGWVDITSGNSGNGSGTVVYKVTGFGGGAPSRTGTMTIAGQTFTVTQVRCTATINPVTQAVPVIGGSFSVSVTTQLGCKWQAAEGLNWANVTSGKDYTGSGTVTYTVQVNVGGARTGTIAIAGETLTINQAGVLP